MKPAASQRSYSRPWRRSPQELEERLEEAHLDLARARLAVMEATRARMELEAAALGGQGYMSPLAAMTGRHPVIPGVAMTPTTAEVRARAVAMGIWPAATAFGL